MQYLSHTPVTSTPVMVLLEMNTVISGSRDALMVCCLFLQNVNQYQGLTLLDD